MTLYYSAGIVPIRFENKEPEFLMLRAYDYFDFPKGKVDEGESFIDAALRETNEESGITEVNFKWGEQFIDTESYRTKVEGKKAKKISRYFLAEYVAGEVCILPNPKTGRIEHHEFKWMTYNDIINGIVLSPRIRKILDWANEIISEVNDE